ncbi:unnamed protein product [Orchesella dallaii]|uniref:Uncharacterized protein n=1 Tax=Orchesella dallaii TaxID=48710 RepID=A0ABP1QY91_9HEXA
MLKTPINVTIYILMLFLFSSVSKNQAQEEEEPSVTEVTLEMFNILQNEVLVLQAELVALQQEMESLGNAVASLASQPPTGSGELADLTTLVTVSNRQEEDITKLFYTNGIWQQNFKVINITFERLKKVVVFPVPVMTAPSFTNAVRRILPVRDNKQNVTTLPTSGSVTTQPTRRPVYRSKPSI